LGLKEITLPTHDGSAVWRHAPLLDVALGEYPRALDGLCKILSLDMRVMDPAWIE